MHPTTSEQLARATAGAEFRGGFGRLYDQAKRASVFGGSYLLGDGRILFFEQRDYDDGRSQVLAGVASPEAGFRDDSPIGDAQQ